jgi:hypothetical protein
MVHVFHQIPFENAVWHALHEHVCQYLRKRNTRCSTVYIFTHDAFDSQLPEMRECGTHNQMQVTGRIKYIAGEGGGECCFSSFPVCVYNISSHYLNNIIVIHNSFRASNDRNSCIQENRRINNWGNCIRKRRKWNGKNSLRRSKLLTSNF